MKEDSSPYKRIPDGGEFDPFGGGIPGDLGEPKPDGEAAFWPKAFHGRTCPDCGRTMDSGDLNGPLEPTKDHIIPKARGGKGAPDNLRVICRSCNSRKGAR